MYKQREAELRQISLPLKITAFSTSIWDETLYKAWSAWFFFIYLIILFLFFFLLIYLIFCSYLWKSQFNITRIIVILFTVYFDVIFFFFFFFFKLLQALLYMRSSRTSNPLRAICQVFAVRLWMCLFIIITLVIIVIYLFSNNDCHLFIFKPWSSYSQLLLFFFLNFNY